LTSPGFYAIIKIEKREENKKMKNLNEMLELNGDYERTLELVEEWISASDQYTKNYFFKKVNALAEELETTPEELKKWYLES
jgi:hypothetical protein